MKRFILHHLAIVFEEVHGEFEVVPRCDVLGHDDVVGAVEEEFAEELDGLAFCHVGLGEEEDGVVVLHEEELVVGREVLGDEVFVFGQEFLWPLA